MKPFTTGSPEKLRILFSGLYACPRLYLCACSFGVYPRKKSLTACSVAEATQILVITLPSDKFTGSQFGAYYTPRNLETRRLCRFASVLAGYSDLADNMVPQSKLKQLFNFVFVC